MAIGLIPSKTTQLIENHTQTYKKEEEAREVFQILIFTLPNYFVVIKKYSTFATLSIP
ncbi:MAG: hypothetical protein GX921_08965 [Bacteroidales bacterium]|nr:hypothetical protein [Bacteroidales bacterium]